MLLLLLLACKMMTLFLKDTYFNFVFILLFLFFLWKTLHSILYVCVCSYIRNDATRAAPNWVNFTYQVGLMTTPYLNWLHLFLITTPFCDSSNQVYVWCDVFVLFLEASPCLYCGYNMNITALDLIKETYQKDIDINYRVDRWDCCWGLQNNNHS